MGVMLSGQSFAAESALPKKSEAQPQASQSVQREVNRKTADAAAEKYKQLLVDAKTAIDETEKALQALNRNRTKEALDALAVATGKLQLVLARNPKLSLAPVHTEVVTQDLLANRDTVKVVLKEAKESLSNGEIQKVRPLIANLASEIQFRTTNIPLETYPSAIKAITPLIDAGKIDEAKAELQATLNTLVVTTEVLPLPKLRTEQLLKEAQSLAEKKDRSKEENDKITKYIQGAREQLEMAELLGYGTKKDYKAMYEQLDELVKKTSDGKSGTGWFDKIKKQLSELF
jgi:hypothetical protein